MKRRVRFSAGGYWEEVPRLGMVFQVVAEQEVRKEGCSPHKAASRKGLRTSAIGANTHLEPHQRPEECAAVSGCSFSSEDRE
jgi:hypothetical protein